ncbi:hypothetical protein [Bacillus xiapuensis]|uniref:hypothetical protein n=1 Tax=Bacillus xiapuensis TaxID=2014075 RepID=UPI000C2437EF|nr:hypothetical protein [Bacillus xiapuensis]
MNKVSNEKGNALITVLLITVIFTVLGLSILASTLGGTKRTAVREEDVDITYEAVKAIDDFTAELSRRLQKNQYALNQLSPGGFTTSLNNEMKDLIADQGYNARQGIESFKASIVPNEKINESETLTRVVEVEATTKAQNSSASRTAVKRLILSPLPSFLKYALGSQDGNLALKGSPHIAGNIFANHLELQKEAEYVAASQSIKNKTIDTHRPSIVGDLYAGEYDESKFKAKDMLELLREDNFYHGEIPDWKNDSQYQKIDFSASYKEERNRRFLKNGLTETSADGLLEGKDLSSVSGVPPELASQITTDKDGNESRPDPFKLVNKNIHKELELDGNLLITNTEEMNLDTLRIKGDVKIVANEKLTIGNLYVTGRLTIINNPGSQLVISGEAVAEQAVSIENEGVFQTNGKLAAHEDLSIENKGTMEINRSAASKQRLSINNATDGKLIVKDALASLTSLSIQNEGTMEIRSEKQAGNASDMLLPTEEKKRRNLYTQQSLTIRNHGKMTIENNLYIQGKAPASEENTLRIESTGSMDIMGDIFSGESECTGCGTSSIIARNSKLSFGGNLFSEGSLILRGDQADPKGENDHLIANGVMYANDETKVSNLNIKGRSKGGEERQLILLSRGDLSIYRINEFSNFADPKEQTEDYLPPPQSGIEPLKAFFYTDQDAELYGVGSLFYIKGGLFAKKNLTINAIRGEMASEKELLRTYEDMDHYYSRFIVDYNEDVLLQVIDSLPKVDYLSIYSGELTVN